MWIWTHTYICTNTQCHVLLHCTCCSPHDCVWQRFSGTVNCRIMFVHHVTIHLLCLRRSKTHHIGQRGCVSLKPHHNQKTWHQFQFKWLLSLSVFHVPIICTSIIFFPYLACTLGYWKQTNTHMHTSMHCIAFTDPGKGTVQNQQRKESYTYTPGLHPLIALSPQHAPHSHWGCFGFPLLCAFPQWCELVCLWFYSLPSEWRGSKLREAIRLGRH